MLSHLSIRNFAIIDTLTIEFDSGLTVVTGETGAGKSIMIDALSLVLGDRADAAVVRADQEQAEIMASFELTEQPRIQSWLLEQALDADGDCIMRRVVSAQGRSKAFINDRPVTLNTLRDLGEQLVDIHGQHAHQALSRATYQMALVDNFGQLGQSAKQVAQQWQQWRQIEAQYQVLQASEQERADRKELLSYQIEELDALQISSEELATIESDHKRLSHLTELMETSQQTVFRLYEDDNASLYSELASVVRNIEEIVTLDPNLQPSLELLHGALIQLQEASQSLQSYQQSIDQDPTEFERLEQRLAELHQVARKHRLDFQQLMPHFQALADELATLNEDSSQLATLENECQQARDSYEQAAQKLSKARHKVAAKMSKAVNHYLEQLGMQGGVFEVRFDSLGLDKANASGFDRIEFMISANPGQPLQPLAKVASGGELSRMSLAIQVVTHSETSIPCLIFDEVDVGIGGGTAEVVGNLLRELSGRAQVLCVTHQAQVAAKGHQHFCVSKASQKQNTRTEIERLEGAQRTEEIARMIGGIEITDKSRRYAEEMLN